jgi:inner membrane protein
MLAYAPIGGVLAALGFELLALCGGALVVGTTMVPDYDRRFDWLDRRGPTHTVWFALGFGVFTGLLAAAVGPFVFGLDAVLVFGFGFAFGAFAVVVHLVADALTPGGVRPFAPLSEATYAFEVQFATSAPGNYALLGVGVLVASLAFLIGGTLAG